MTLDDTIGLSSSKSLLDFTDMTGLVWRLMGCVLCLRTGTRISRERVRTKAPAGSCSPTVSSCFVVHSDLPPICDPWVTHLLHTVALTRDYLQMAAFWKTNLQQTWEYNLLHVILPMFFIPRSQNNINLYSA
jgi:hypothetical protein